MKYTDEETLVSIKKAFKGKWYSSFEFDGVIVENPLKDKNGKKVDPVGHYGIKNIDSYLGRFGARL